MEDKKETYRGIVKGTALFGGVQVFNVLINVIRGKLIAILLGPTGMGISALLTSAVTPIQLITTLGLPSSAIRDISVENDPEKKSIIAGSFVRLMIVASIVGFLVSIILSPWLSQTTFGNKEHITSFILLSAALIFYVMNQCYNSILQGYRRLKDLALCNMVGPTAGLLVGVPLYYIYGLEGIVPAMIILAFVSSAVSYYGVRKIGLAKHGITWHSTFTVGKALIGLGIVMMTASALGNISTFALNAVIRLYGSISDVGLFQAANSVVNQYVGMVIAAIATDYYPHLSSVINDKKKTYDLVNKEGEITLFIIAPLAALIVITAPLIIKIFLTDEFESVLFLIRFMAIGVILKTAVFPIGYMAIAKGDKTFYFYMDGIWSNLKTFILFAIFYYIWGLIGMGYATIVNSILDIFVVAIVNNWRYGITYRRSLYVKILFVFAVTWLCLLCSYINNIYLSYIAMAFIFSFLFLYCFWELDKRVDVKGIILNKIKH